MYDSELKRIEEMREKVESLSGILLSTNQYNSARSPGENDEDVDRK